MNKHLKALSVVIGLILVGVAITLAYKSKQAEEASEGDSKPAVVLNQQVSDFDSKTIADKPLKLSQFAGKVTIVNFWASWCGPCIEEMPSLIKLLKTFPNDVELVAISGDSNMADIESFLKSFPELKAQTNIHVVFDQDKGLSQKYQIYRLPESFILDRKQNVVKKISGSIDWFSQDAQGYMKTLVAK